ncbi:MAG: acetyl-CoA synthetase, partial [Halovenus sp.]
MTQTLGERGEVVHEPDETFVEGSNVHAFMQEYGIDDFEQLHRQSVTAVEGVDA